MKSTYQKEKIISIRIEECEDSKKIRTSFSLNKELSKEKKVKLSFCDCHKKIHDCFLQIQKEQEKISIKLNKNHKGGAGCIYIISSLASNLHQLLAFKNFIKKHELEGAKKLIFLLDAYQEISIEIIEQLFCNEVINNINWSEKEFDSMLERIKNGEVSDDRTIH